ncbi:MAG: YfhO family protein [Acidobacteria bacterium]|nr:YfhO family protein [Acidobacteriota bacterium]
MNNAETSPDKRERLVRWGTGALLLLLPLLYFYPAVLQGVALMPGDGWSQNIGVRLLVGRMLLKGFLPLWNPYMFGGTPLLASAYPGVLYPPNWLFAIVPYNVAMNATVISSYHIALIGTYLYVRRLGIIRVAALLGGITYAFSGYMIAHLGHTPRIAAAAWLPWIMLSLELLYQRVAWRWIALGAVSICMPLFASEPQVVVYALMVGGAYVLFSAYQREALRSRRSYFFACGGMVAIGALLGALQVLPSMELMRQGFRAQLTYDSFNDSSFPLRHVFTFIYPYFYGGMHMPPYRVEYWGDSWLSELGGYAGVLSLLLGIVAVIARKNRMTVFWVGVIAVALFLAVGDYLPYKLNHLLFRLPVYNKFRVSGRHVMEIGFAVAVLAALGVQTLTTLETAARRRVLRFSSAIFAGLFAVTAVAYCFLQRSLEFDRPRLANAADATNPEQLIPLVLGLLSVLIVWWYAHQPRWWTSTLMVALMMADMASFGHFFEWNEGRKFSRAPLADPPTIAALKAREKDRNAFRIVSHSSDLHGKNYLLLNGTNLSQMRGLQTVHGFDVLMLKRYSELVGNMGDMGAISDYSVFGAAHQGLNLMNVKYALYEVPTPENTESEELAGWRFSKTLLSLRFPEQRQYDLDGRGTVATKLAFVSAMGGAVHVPEGTLLARVRLQFAGGQVSEHELRVGRDSAEWAWERPDVREKIKHKLPPHLARTWPEKGFDGHEYLSEISFSRAAVENIEIVYALPPDGATWEIARATLRDETTNEFYFPERRVLDATRWRKLERFGDVEIYENLKALPRAWFVKQTRVLPRADLYRAITEGKFSDGAAFDPATTALLEEEDKHADLPAPNEAANARAEVTLYEPNRIRLATENTAAGLLVLSENYFRAWEATVDGLSVPVKRVDHNLRGVIVPAGQHRVEFRFRSRAVFIGAILFAIGVSALVVGGLVSVRRKRRLTA